VLGGALQLSGVGLHLRELEHRAKSPMGEHKRIALLSVKQALKDAVGSGGPDKRDIRVARSAEVANDAVLVSTLGVGHLGA